VVIKGGARGRAGDLAAHLQRTDTNERAEVKELRGVVAGDLDGALREMAAVASGTRSKRPLYHASVNTAPDEPLTEEQWTRAIDRLEEKLGLTGQPRVVVEHEKGTREHRHVVWSRIDLEQMRAISDSHNYRKHEEVARELEQEFGHKRVQGAHAERDGAERPERTPSHAEMQQAERTKLTPQQAKEQITAIWQRTDNGKAFAAALEQEGWILALGDRRDFVLIDHKGEPHSLAKRVEGAKTKDVRARMADLDPATVPDVEQAKVQQRARQVAREEVRTAATPAPAPAPEPQPASQQAEPEQPPQIPTPATPEPDATTLAPVAVAPILEPDPPRGNTAAERGSVAVEGSTAPPALAVEASEHVASRDADSVQAADQDNPAAAGTPTAAESVEPAPVHTGNEAESVEAEQPAESFNLAGGLAHGAGVALEVGAKVVEGVLGFLDGLVGGGGKPTPAKAAEPKPAMTAKERHAARLQAFRDADQQSRAARQEAAQRLGASEALTDEQLRWEQETQEKRHQDRFTGRSE